MIIAEPVPKGDMLLKLTANHGVDVGDLPALACCWSRPAWPSDGRDRRFRLVRGQGRPSPLAEPSGASWTRQSSVRCVNASSLLPAALMPTGIR